MYTFAIRRIPVAQLEPRGACTKRITESRIAARAADEHDGQRLRQWMCKWLRDKRTRAPEYDGALAEAAISACNLGMEGGGLVMAGSESVVAAAAEIVPPLDVRRCPR